MPKTLASRIMIRKAIALSIKHGVKAGKSARRFYRFTVLAGKVRSSITNESTRVDDRSVVVMEMMIAIHSLVLLLIMIYCNGIKHPR